MDPGTVSAAPPYIASALVKLANFTRPCTQASSGSFAIDDFALEGGYRYGEITSIAGPKGTGKTLLGYHAIASHLLIEGESREDLERRRIGNEVALIDTTGGFSAIRLRDVLIFRLRARWQRQRDFQDGQRREEKEEFKQEATEMLGRVRVMRVFDLIGILEALGEIGEKAVEGKGRRQGKRKREVVDSEDEDQDGDDVDERRRSDDCQNTSNQSSAGLILIDNMANVTSSVVSRSLIQGQALLANCMRALQHLVNRHQMSTILINSGVGLTSSTNPQHYRNIDDHVSIFASSLGKPGSGIAFTYLIDTSVYLSLIPKMQEDAVTAYGDPAQDRGWSKAVVLEVLKDRKGGREGRWAVFEVEDSVKLVACSGNQEA